MLTPGRKAGAQCASQTLKPRLVASPDAVAQARPRHPMALFSFSASTDNYNHKSRQNTSHGCPTSQECLGAPNLPTGTNLRPRLTAIDQPVPVSTTVVLSHLWLVDLILSSSSQDVAIYGYS